MKTLDIRDLSLPEDVSLIVIDETELRTDFDTGVTKVSAKYCKGTVADYEIVHEIRLSMSNEYVSDMYRISGEISDDVLIQAALNTAKTISEEKGLPEMYGGVICKSNHPLMYVPKIDMTSI